MRKGQIIVLGQGDYGSREVLVMRALTDFPHTKVKAAIRGYNIPYSSEAEKIRFYLIQNHLAEEIDYAEIKSY